MKPFYADDWLTLYGGDCREVLASLPADSVDCVVTSPPYWGLRDYGTEGQLGLERTPEEYVANMVNVFREVRRVLKPSGTCWLNLGDSYAGSGMTGGTESKEGSPGRKARMFHGNRRDTVPGLAQKQLVGIPWRVAFALQADGWYLRSDIIWSKPNPMPESVTDRPTKSHEYLFLLTKSARYYFDADAVREEGMGREVFGNTGRKQLVNGDRNDGGRQDMTPSTGRNIRSVWTIATRPYPGAHFAVFPPELPERCIKAGSSEKGVCPECGAPWERVVEAPKRGAFHDHSKDAEQGNSQDGRARKQAYLATRGERREQGWQPTCVCTRPGIPVPWPRGMPLDEFYPDPRPAVILDPFGGSGTVGMVANRISRRAILIDLNPDYLKQQMKRNAQTPLGLDAA